MPDHFRVVANPFLFLDHEGQPAATFPLDPSHGAGARAWVGATIDRSLAADGKPKTRPRVRDRETVMTQKITRKDPNGRVRVETVRIGSAAAVRVVFAFDLSPQDVPPLEHYAKAVKRGELIAADARTAQRCGVAFVDPDAVLRASAEKAVAEHTRDLGEPPPVETWADNLRGYLPAPVVEPAALAEPTQAEPTITPAAAPDLITEPGGPA